DYPGDRKMSNKIKAPLKLLAGAIVAAAAVLGSSTALAAAAPKLPALIRVVVPFTPGGSNDVYARAIADQLGQRVGRPVVVDNKPGAGGAIGAADVARSKPDGGTLLFTSNSLITRAAVDDKL